MDLWHILVLAVVRHACGTNWDTLETWANHHELVRKVMGVHATAFIEDEKMEFNYQTILDNVSMIDEDLLQEINLMVVDAGHQLLKKKEDEAMQLKTDSYAVETNVHSCLPVGKSPPTLTCCGIAVVNVWTWWKICRR